MKAQQAIEKLEQWYNDHYLAVDELEAIRDTAKGMKVTKEAQAELNAHIALLERKIAGRK